MLSWIPNSIAANRIAIRNDAISRRSCLCPHPRSSRMIVIEVSPKVILSTLGLSPIPIPFHLEIRPVHISHVVTVSKCCKFSGGTEGSLAQIIANLVTGNFQTANRVSDCDDASSPPLIEGLVGVGLGSVIWEELVEGSVESFGVDDASDGQFGGAGGVSWLRIASVAGHPANVIVFLCWPNSGPECESFLICDALSIIREELATRVFLSVLAWYGHEQ